MMKYDLMGEAIFLAARLGIGYETFCLIAFFSGVAMTLIVYELVSAMEKKPCKKKK